MNWVGTGGNDWKFGGNSADTLEGAGGNDILFGLDEADLLEGQDGADTLYGGDGADYLIGGAGNDSLNGGENVDWADYAGAAGAVTIDMRLSVWQDTGGAGVDYLVYVENLLGSDHDDFIWGSIKSNLLLGGDGADTLAGSNGRDSLYGGDGDDILGGGDNDDLMDGGAGSDTLTFAGSSIGITVDLRTSSAQNTGRGVDSLVSIENVVGSNIADTIIASSAANRLEGAIGEDRYVFNTLADLDGDTIVKAAGVGDMIDLSGIDADTALAGDQAFALVLAFTGAAGQAVYVGGDLQLDVNGDGVSDASLTVTGSDIGVMGFVL